MKLKNVLISVFFISSICMIITICGLSIYIPDNSCISFAENIIIASEADCTFDGTGTSDDPYIISSETQLCELSSLIAEYKLNKDSRLYSSLCYKLTKNLDMSGIDFKPIGNNESFYIYMSIEYIDDSYMDELFKPEVWTYAKQILLKFDGVNYFENTDESFNDEENYYLYYSLINSFYGEFDGNGKTISNLNVSNYSEAGLFGRIQNALIKDLIIDNANINGTFSCGGIAGIGIFSEINHCYVINSIINSPSENSIAGGIIGLCPVVDDYVITIYDDNGDLWEAISLYNLTDFINQKRDSSAKLCLNHNSLISAKSFSGGICGKSENVLINDNYGLKYIGLIIENCLNYADVFVESGGIAGGIIGYSGGSINNCLSFKGCNNKNEYAILGEPISYQIPYGARLDPSFYPSELITDTNLNYTYDTNELLSDEFLDTMGNAWILPQNSNSTYYYPTIDVNYAIPFTGYVVTANEYSYSYIVNADYGKITFPEFTAEPSGYCFIGYKTENSIYNEFDTIDITKNISVDVILDLENFTSQLSQYSYVNLYDSEYHYITASYNWDYDVEVSVSYKWYFSEGNTIFEELSNTIGNTLSVKNVNSNGFYYCETTLSDGILSTSSVTEICNVIINPINAVLSVTLPFDNAVYTGNIFSLNPSLDYENVYENDKSNITTNFSVSETIKDVGNYSISVNATNDNYLFTYVPCYFSVLPAEIVCVSSPQTLVYSKLPNYPIVNATTVDDCEYSVTYSLTDNNYGSELFATVPVGNYTVYYKVSAENHNSFYGMEQVSVTPNIITLTKNSNPPIIEKTYDSTTTCPVKLITEKHFSASFTGPFSGESPFSIESANFAVSKVIQSTEVTVVFQLSDTENFTLDENVLVFNGRINYAKINISIKENKTFEKVYDGKTTLPINGFFSLVPYLNVTADYNTYNIILSEGIYNSPNVSDATSVTFHLGLAGINYVFADGSSSLTFPARILPRELQIKEGSVSALNRKYDGTEFVEIIGGELEIKPEDYGIFTLTEIVYPVFGPATVSDIEVSSTEKYVNIEYINVSSSNYFVSDTLSGVLTVIISKATPIVNPITNTEIFSSSTELPAILLSDGDTPGTIEWEPYIINENLETQLFSWTFTPIDNNNFTSLSGNINFTIIKVKPVSLRAEFYGTHNYNALETFNTDSLTVYVHNNDGSEYKINERTSHESGFYVYYGENAKDCFYANDTEVSIRYNTQDGFIETFIPITVDILILPVPTVIGEYTFNGADIVLKLDSVFSSELMSISGNKQLHAGSYTATITLKDTVNYKWETTTDSFVNVEWFIKKLSVHTPTLVIQKFVYTSQPITPEILHNERNPINFYTVNGDLSAVNANAYNITATFVSTDFNWYENGSSEPLNLSWEITPCSIEIPILDKTITEYDGIEHTVDIATSDLFTYSGDTTYKNAGNYAIVATLNDSANYVWSNGSNEPININYTVLKPKYEKPHFQNKNYIFNGSTYSIPVFSTDFYTVSGQVSSRNCGDFTITISLNDETNMLWDDETTEPIIIRWAIQPAVLISPTLTSNCVYNGQQQAAFIVYDSKFCAITGNIETNSGDYTATISIVDKQNCKWDNGTTSDITIDWEITPFVVEVPKMPENLLYNGFEQTVSIPQSSAYTITGNKGTDANSYNATLKLNDKNNYVWSNGQTTDININWKICSLTFSSNGSNLDAEYSLGSALPSPRIDGYIFDGWYLSADYNGDKITSLSDIDENTILYAKWIETGGNTLIKNEDNSPFTDKVIAGIAILGGALFLAIIIIILGVVMKKKPRSNGGNGRSIM